MALFNEKTTRHVTELKTPFENFPKIHRDLNMYVAVQDKYGTISQHIG